MSKVKDEKSVDKTAEPSKHPFSLATSSINKYDPYSLKAAIDEEIVEVSRLDRTK